MLVGREQQILMKFRGYIASKWLGRREESISGRERTNQANLAFGIHFQVSTIGQVEVPTAFVLSPTHIR